MLLAEALEITTMTFKLYATFKDGKGQGMKPASDVKFRTRKTAEVAGSKLLEAGQISRHLVIPCRRRKV